MNGDEFQVLMALAAVLVLAPLIRAVLERVGVPAVVGFLALGVLLRLIEDRIGFLTPLFEHSLTLLADLGVVALLFRVGLRSNLAGLLAKLPTASLLWLGDVLVNFVLGYLAARYLLGLALVPALVAATALTVTSVGVSVAVWQDAGRLNTPTGQLLIDVAELDDISGILLLVLLLAVVPVLTGGAADPLPLLAGAAGLMLAKLALFVTACYLFARHLEPQLTRFSRRIERSEAGLTLTIVGVGLAIAALAGALGFSLAIGAMFAGLAFSRDPDAVRSDRSFTALYDFFTPFFFIHIGMALAPEAMQAALLPGLVLAGVGFIGKLAGVGLPARWTGSSPRQALLLGLSMAPRAEIAMVILYQASLLGPDVVPPELYGALLVVSALTCALAPLLLRPRLAAA